MFQLESALKFLTGLSCLLVSAAFGAAWFQHALGPLLGFESGLQFHVALSGIAVLTSLFSDTFLIFYFVGTGVWMKDRSKDLVSGQKRDAAVRVWNLYETANKLKASSLPLATFGIVLALFSFILGGARQVGAIPTWIHPTLAAAFTLNALLGLKVHFRNIQRNLGYLDQVSTELDDLNLVLQK